MCRSLALLCEIYPALESPFAFSISAKERHFIGINGAIHNISIEGVKALTLHRGRVTTVRFTPQTPGIIKIQCFDHQPNMNGQIVVLAKDSRGSH